MDIDEDFFMLTSFSDYHHSPVSKKQDVGMPVLNCWGRRKGRRKLADVRLPRVAIQREQGKTSVLRTYNLGLALADNGASRRSGAKGRAKMLQDHSLDNGVHYGKNGHLKRAPWTETTEHFDADIKAQCEQIFGNRGDETLPSNSRSMLNGRENKKPSKTLLNTAAQPFIPLSSRSRSEDEDAVAYKTGNGKRKDRLKLRSAIQMSSRPITREARVDATNIFSNDVIQPFDTPTNSICQAMDSRSNTVLQPMDSRSNTVLQPMDTSSDFAFQPKDIPNNGVLQPTRTSSNADFELDGEPVECVDVNDSISNGVDYVVDSDNSFHERDIVRQNPVPAEYAMDDYVLPAGIDEEMDSSNRMFDDSFSDDEDYTRDAWSRNRLDPLDARDPVPPAEYFSGMPRRNGFTLSDYVTGTGLKSSTSVNCFKSAAPKNNWYSNDVDEFPLLSVKKKRNECKATTVKESVDFTIKDLAATLLPGNKSVNEELVIDEVEEVKNNEDCGGTLLEIHGLSSDVTEQLLKSYLQDFGKVLNISLNKIQDNTIARVWMESASSCEWILSCLDDSPSPLGNEANILTVRLEE